MLKQEKLDSILEAVNTKGTITVKEIMESLDVSDMTARRYLQELADRICWFVCTVALKNFVQVLS